MSLQTLYQRAIDHHQRGRLLDAIADYDEIIAREPNHAEVHVNRGAALALLNRDEEALVSFNRAAMLKPNDADILVNNGMALGKLGHYAEALKILDRAVALAPRHIDGHQNRGKVLAIIGRHEEALASFDRVTDLAPNSVHGHFSRGIELYGLGHYEQCLEAYDHALKLVPDFINGHHNRSRALTMLGRHDEALESLNRAIALNPRMPVPQFDKALVLLRLGDYENGLQHYEWRLYGGAPVKSREFMQARWRGEPIEDKTIFLHAEQGLGDSLQMLRYLPLVKARAAHVVLELPKNIPPVLGSIADGITLREAAHETPLPPFDLHCPLMSLPLAFGARLDTIPAPRAYLTAPNERLSKWRERLPKSTAPRVGLIWSASRSPHRIGNRDIALKHLMPLLNVAGISFVSLQREYRDYDLPLLSQLPIERIDDAIHDFGDTAAAIEQCDLVISVDTAAAHLAGALGKPVWLLLSHAADWRWLLDRTDSPWYPSARLFRQSRRGAWDEPIARVAEELQAFRQK